MSNLFENDNGAQFSECRKYRYALWRIWDKTKPLVMFIGLNPSTANENDNDPTIKSVCRIAKHNGFGGAYMLNCFPLISTNPAVLIEFYDTLYHEAEDIENMRWLLEVKRQCAEVVFAWGSFDIAKARTNAIIGHFKDAKALAINKNGTPKHPLYVKGDTIPIKFTV